MSGPSAKDHLERIEAMSKDRGQTWDLSPNDQATLAWAAAELRRLAGVDRELGIVKTCHTQAENEAAELVQHLEDARARVAELETAMRRIHQRVMMEPGASGSEAQFHRDIDSLVRLALTPKPEAGR